MKQPCYICKNSRWLHSPNDYNLPTYAYCTKEFQSGPKPDECSGFEPISAVVADLIKDNVKKYRTKGRS